MLISKNFDDNLMSFLDQFGAIQKQESRCMVRNLSFSMNSSYLLPKKNAENRTKNL